MKFPIDKTVIGGKKYELRGVTYHSGSPMSGHCTVAVKFKKRWWNCNDAVVKIMEEGKVRKGSIGSCLYTLLQANVRIFENYNVNRVFG